MKWLLVALALVLGGCCKSYCPSNEKEFTLGSVQKEIRVGMSETGVIQALGSPNIVTKDAEGKESYVYDKISSDVSYVNEQGGVWLLVVGFGKDTGRVVSSQKTLTVVVKFDKNHLVETVSYHSTKF